jgi:hypothetical protein
MKTIKNTAAVSALALALMLGSCFSHNTEEEGSVTLYFGVGGGGGA